MEFYQDTIHHPMDRVLTSACGRFRCDPNRITILSLLMIVPVLLSPPPIGFLLCLLHDVLDRLDGSMARLLPKRDGRVGATLDACCDKIYAILFLSLHANVPFWARTKVILHGVALLTRIVLHNTTLRTASRMHGKAGTWLENMSFAALCLGWSTTFQIAFGLSYGLATLSWLQKVTALGLMLLSAALQ